jgi:DNA end-binding protein Ku
VPDLEQEQESEDFARHGRPMWSGTISFGLVSVPVLLASGNRGNRVALHMVTEEGTQLARRYFTENGRKPLDDDDIVRGYEIEKGKFVPVEDEDLERLAPEVTRDIDLSVFVPVEDVDPMYFVRSYFLIPGQGGAKAYRLLARVMEEMGRAGIARFVMRAKEYLVALIAENGILRAETLRFANELRTAEDVGLPSPTRVAAADERKFATQMKKLYKTKFSPTELTDTTAAELIKIAQKKKRAGDDVVKVTEPETEEAPAPSGNVLDLMERLKQSLKTNGASEGAGKRTGRKRAARKTTAKRRSRGRAA